ncbi:MAG: hypothetical protein ACOCV4_01490 [Myxococcota bacterium]
MQSVEPAVALGVVGAGAFLLIGMLTGIWKYAWMRRPPDHRAPLYVDIAHRAALLYAPACLVLAALAWLARMPGGIEVAAVAVNEAFFAAAVASYLFHGVRGTERTQMAERNFLTVWGMYALIVGEIGGTTVLLIGALRALA